MLRSITPVLLRGCSRYAARTCSSAYSSYPDGVKTLTGEKSVNSVTLIGRVGQDPVIRGSENHPVTVMSVATSVSYKDGYGGYNQKTEWHRVSVFAPVLRDYIPQIIKKGDKVYVQGSLNYSTYENASGATVNATNIIANEVILLEKKRQAQMQNQDFSDEFADFEEEKV